MVGKSSLRSLVPERPAMEENRKQFRQGTACVKMEIRKECVGVGEG